MDQSLGKIFEQVPWVTIILYLWQKTAEERREWRSWFEAQQADLTKVIEANTAALTKSTETLGEANAARLSCPGLDASRFQRTERAERAERAAQDQHEHKHPKPNGEDR